MSQGIDINQKPVQLDYDFLGQSQSRKSLISINNEIVKAARLFMQLSDSVSDGTQLKKYICVIVKLYHPQQLQKHQIGICGKFCAVNHKIHRKGDIPSNIKKIGR